MKAAYQGRTPSEMPQVIIGTGFFISREGHVLTNASGVMNNDRVWIVYKGVDYSAKMIGIDSSTNLALLKVLTLPEDFPFLQISDSQELPEIGTMLVRIACPMDLAPSPSMGIISGKESSFAQHNFPCALLRTSIPAAPGESGGAYLDLNGRLVGIQVASLTEISSTYVLPARAVMRVRDDLLFYGKMTKGWVGFDISIESSVNGGPQVVISNVITGSPASKSGIERGDQLEQVGIYKVKNADDLMNAMFYTRIGEYVPIKILRRGKEIELTIKVAERPPESEMPASGVTEEEDAEPAVINQSDVAPGPTEPLPEELKEQEARPE